MTRRDVPIDAARRIAVSKLADILAEYVPRAGCELKPMRREMDARFASVALSGTVHRSPLQVGRFRAEWSRPTGAGSAAAILHLHGGGYSLGSIETVRPLATALADATAIPVLALDYRLAPEHPFPAALEDVVHTYRWLLEQGYRPDQLVITGDSAGGGLAIAAMLEIRNQRLGLPFAAMCFSPWTDLTLSSPCYETHAPRDNQVDRAFLAEAARHYLAETAPTTPLASPVFADLRGLPPLLIQVGAEEVLLGDAYRLEELAEQAGVDVTLECWDGMFHLWHGLAPRLPEAVNALAGAAKWLSAVRPQQEAARPSQPHR